MKNLEKISQRYYKVILILIFLTALALRWYFLPQRNINFIFDQARDAFTVNEIVNGDLKILGPPTSDGAGLHHGVLYYYLITPAYLLGRGDPMFAAGYIGLINALAIIPVFYLTYLLTKKYYLSLIASFLFAFSFDAIQFSSFISNVSLGILFIPMLFVGLYLWITKKTKFAPVITGLFLGLSVQSDIAFLYYFIPVLIWLFVVRKSLKIGEIFLFLASFVFAVSTMIIAEVLFGFPAFKGISYLFSGDNQVLKTATLAHVSKTLFMQIGERFTNAIYPSGSLAVGIAGFGALGYLLIKEFLDKKTKSFRVRFISSYLLAHAVTIPFGGSITPYIMVGVIPAVSIFLAMLLGDIFEKKKTLLLISVFILALLNFSSLISKKNGPNPDYFTDKYLLSKELAVIDYTYQKANGKPFSISTLTAPLYINTLWSYLYNWYGQQKYGYVPYWVGRDQIGQLGNNLKSPPDDLEKHFFIQEPSEAIPDIWETYARGDQESISTVVEEKRFGGMTVEERIIRK